MFKKISTIKTIATFIIFISCNFNATQINKINITENTFQNKSYTYSIIDIHPKLEINRIEEFKAEDFKFECPMSKLLQKLNNKNRPWENFKVINEIKKLRNEKSNDILMESFINNKIDFKQHAQFFAINKIIDDLENYCENKMENEFLITIDKLNNYKSQINEIFNTESRLKMIFEKKEMEKISDIYFVISEYIEDKNIANIIKSYCYGISHNLIPDLVALLNKQNILTIHTNEISLPLTILKINNEPNTIVFPKDYYSNPNYELSLNRATEYESIINRIKNSLENSFLKDKIYNFYKFAKYDHCLAFGLKKGGSVGIYVNAHNEYIIPLYIEKDYEDIYLDEYFYSINTRKNFDFDIYKLSDNKFIITKCLKEQNKQYLYQLIIINLRSCIKF